MEEINKEIAGIRAIMVDKSDDVRCTSLEMNGKAFDILELLAGIAGALSKTGVESKAIIGVVSLGIENANAS